MTGFLRGFPGKSRSGYVRDEMEAGGRSRLDSQQHANLQGFLGDSTGATGLEPATSGVTVRQGATGYNRL
jgi:hypothetical protein